MKQLKKCMLGAFLAICVLGLSACGDNKSNSKDTTQTTESTKTT